MPTITTAGSTIYIKLAVGPTLVNITDTGEVITASITATYRVSPQYLTSEIDRCLHHRTRAVYVRHLEAFAVIPPPPCVRQLFHIM